MCERLGVHSHVLGMDGRDRGKRQQMPLVIHEVLQLRSARHFAAAELRSG